MNNTHTDDKDALLKTIIDETTETLAYTIDAKDKYTRGHSFRVARYARHIAFLAGKSFAECREIYLAGLLHDIGKISINDNIINKYGELTPSEYEEMKMHTVNGAKILEKMKSVPYLQKGALYHHERYDGQGYPHGLKGNDIPELARIIAVADAYDTMTSNRSYRGAYDQAVAKQEIWKGMGTQFDPYFAKVMISLIDADINYDMREKPNEGEDELFGGEEIPIVWKTSIPKNIKADERMMQETNTNCFGAFVKNVPYWFDPTEGILIEEKEKIIEFNSITDKKAAFLWCVPVGILFSSENGEVVGPGYDEMGVFVSACYSWKNGSAKSEKTSLTRTKKFKNWDHWLKKNKEGMKYRFHVSRTTDHVLIKLESDYLIFDANVLLRDTFNGPVYMALSGENCTISDVNVI